MRLFRFPKRNAKYADEETPLMRFFRYIIIALLFCAVIWGFWMNNQRRMDMLKKPVSTSIDRTGVLGAEQERQLAAFQEQFKRAYGIPLVIHVGGIADVTGLLRDAPDAMRLGIAPDSAQIVFDAPPLASAALGEPLTLYLRHVHFVPYFARQDWPRGLEGALNLIAARLDAAVTGNAATPR